MHDHEERIRRHSRYGSAVTRFYLWVGICICYFWLVFGIIGGLLIMCDGSKIFRGRRGRHRVDRLEDRSVPQAALG